MLMIGSQVIDHLQLIDLIVFDIQLPLVLVPAQQD
jgi:hypothetical protein